MPRIRPARRSGWKTSSASVFSPVPRNLTGNAGDGPDREGGAAARVAIDLGQDEAGHRHRGDERLRDRDGLLAGHRVDDEQRLDRLHRRVDGGDLGHQRLVDASAGRRCRGSPRRGPGAWRPRRPGGRCPTTGSRGRPDRPGCRAACRASASWSAAAGRYGSAATSSGRRPELDDVPGELGACDVVLPEPWRPTIATTAGLPDQVEGPVARRQQVDQLVVDDLDDLLAGGQALEDLLADRPLADPRDEVLDDLEVDVGLEQRQPDLAHRGVDVGLADPAAAGQRAEGRCAAAR